MDVWRVCVWLPGQGDPTSNGHPTYVWPRQGQGRVDDPEHEYLVLYLGDSPAGAVAEYLGDYPRWTPAVLQLTPAAPPGSSVALARFELRRPVLDLDDPEVLSEWNLRPSEVVTRDRQVTQQWARAIYDTQEYAGVAWWSYREPRWASLGLWDISDVHWDGQAEELTLDHPALLEAGDVLRRPIEP